MLWLRRAVSASSQSHHPPASRSPRVPGGAVPSRPSSSSSSPPLSAGGGGRLLGIHVFRCPDAVGIVAKLAERIASRGGNIHGVDVFVPENKQIFYSRRSISYAPSIIEPLFRVEFQWSLDAPRSPLLSPNVKHWINHPKNPTGHHPPDTPTGYHRFNSLPVLSKEAAAAAARPYKRSKCHGFWHLAASDLAVEARKQILSRKIPVPLLLSIT